jgi:hypothetical protein
MKFSAANTKLKKLYKLATTVLKRWLGQKIGRSTAKVYSFDILSGVDCPFAFNCKSQAEEQADGSRRIKDGPHTKFRCFSASQEVLFTNTYKSRKRNHDAIHSLETSLTLWQTDCVQHYPRMPESFVFMCLVICSVTSISWHGSKSQSVIKMFYSMLTLSL